MTRLLWLVLGTLGWAASWAAAPAGAQDYPTKTVRIIVPFAPGAGNDILGRLTAEHLTPRLKQSVVVENKPGAGSQIGIDYVAKSPPDGHTLIWAASDGISILPAVRKNMPYKVPEDFTFVSRIVLLPFTIAVNPKLPINSLADMIAWAKANPKKLRYGTSGVGGAPHMGTVLLEKATGTEMVHVPYSGVAPSITDLLGGHIEMALATPQTIRPHAEAGNVRVIATTGNERHPLFPNVPIVKETGVANLSVIVWYGILAPAGTPEPILVRLREAIADMLKDPAVEARLKTLGYQESYLAGDAFKQYVLDDLKQWRDVAQGAGISLQD